MPDDDVEATLDQWVNAKRAKDFVTADRIRMELRARGVEPDKVRPALSSGTRPAAQPSMSETHRAPAAVRWAPPPQFTGHHPPVHVDDLYYAIFAQVTYLQTRKPQKE